MAYPILVSLISAIVLIGVLYFLIESNAEAAKKAALAVRRANDELRSIAASLLALIKQMPIKEQETLASFLETKPDIDAHLRRQETANEISLQLQRMRIWEDPAAKEDPCMDVFCDNIWLLRPDLELVSDTLFKRSALTTIASHLFKRESLRHPPRKWKFPPLGGKQPDACGIFRSAMRISGTGDLDTEKVLLIVEAKRPSLPVTQFVMDEALSYAVNLRKITAEVDTYRIECLAVGKRIAPGVQAQTFRWGNEANQVITVTPVTWKALRQRADFIAPTQIGVAAPRIHEEPRIEEDDDDDEELHVVEQLHELGIDEQPSPEVAHTRSDLASTQRLRRSA